MSENTTLVKYKEEIAREISDPETLGVLVATTFNGIPQQQVKRALLEGMMRGFEFKDFLKKNVYAIPFKNSYSLVTSIDYARKIGMNSGVVGVSEPKYEMKADADTGKESIESCSITVKRRFEGTDYIGEYTATVYFDEYTTGRNLWTSKPRTMIAKVAEMHALRKACPEELSKAYAEEEMHQEPAREAEVIDVTKYEQELRACKTEEEFKTLWADVPAQAKTALDVVKDEMKEIFNKPNKTTKKQDGKSTKKATAKKATKVKEPEVADIPEEDNPFENK